MVLPNHRTTTQTTQTTVGKKFALYWLKCTFCCKKKELWLWSSSGLNRTPAAGASKPAPDVPFSAALLCLRLSHWRLTNTPPHPPHRRLTHAQLYALSLFQPFASCHPIAPFHFLPKSLLLLHSLSQNRYHLFSRISWICSSTLSPWGQLPRR